jgi:hypothetical protein
MEAFDGFFPCAGIEYHKFINDVGAESSDVSGG